MVNMANGEENGLKTWIEIINASSLKEDVRMKEGLSNDGLIIKKIHKSDIKVSYEKMEGGLAGFLDRKLSNCPNLPAFLEEARKKFH